MGKGARNRIKNAEENQLKKQQMVKDTKNKKRNRIIGGAIAAVLAVAILVSSLVYSFYYANGTFLRKDVVATSESVTVDNAMMLYFFDQTLKTYQNYYGDYFYALTGIEEGKSLKNFDYDEEQTWFEMLRDTSEEALAELMILSDAAKEAGFTLTEEQQKVIDRRVEETDVSDFSKYLNKEDYRKCMELTALASMYKNSLTDSYSFTEDEVDSYYQENSKDFKTVDFRRYSFSFSEEEDSELPTEEEAKKNAEKLEAADSEDEFLDMVSEFAKASDPEITDEDLQSRLDATLTENETYVEGSELSEWLFDDSRKAGDTYIHHTDGNTVYTVYYLVSPAKRNEKPTVTTRHILLTTNTYGTADAAKAKAEELLAQWESGDKTAESFGDLAFEYTEDANSLYSGGKYADIPEGALVQQYNDWLFDPDRKPGDTDIIETDYGYHVVYFEGEGPESWKGNVIAAMKNEKYEKELETLKEKFSVSFDNEKIENLPV